MAVQNSLTALGTASKTSIATVAKAQFIKEAGLGLGMGLGLGAWLAVGAVVLGTVVYFWASENKV